MASQPENELPLWFWLGLPVLFFLFILVVIIFFPAQIDRVIERENGIVELGTAIILLPGIVAGVLCFLGRDSLPAGWLGFWLLLVTLGCVYIAGEEISWGQHLLDWGTPEYLQRINDQQETNIHNISSWFDQKPRILLELWVLIGGIVLVLWRYFKKIQYSPHDWRVWFWPGIACFPAASIAILIRMPERYQSITGEWPLLDVVSDVLLFQDDKTSRFALRFYSL
jgi:hypothetical protein